MDNYLTIVAVLVPLASGCARVFPGNDGREATDGGNTISPEIGDGSRPSSSRVVDGSTIVSSGRPAFRKDAGAPEALDGGATWSSGSPTSVDAAHDASSSAPRETLEGNTTTAVGLNAESDNSTIGLSPTVRSLSVCWAQTGFEQEKEWIVEVLDSAIEQTALLDFTGWGLCADEAASDIGVYLTQSAASSPTTPTPPETWIGDAGQVTSSAYVSLGLSTADTHTHAVDAAMGDENGCDPASYSEDGPFVDVIGRIWSSERHYCVAGKALTRFMAMLVPDQPSFGCSTVGSTPLNPDFGYHDATSIFGDCPPVGAYLSQLDRTLLMRERGARRGALIWFGLGSLGRLQDPARPVTDDRLFTDVLPVPAEDARTPVIGDFNGDGFDDIFMYGKGNLPDELIWGAATFAWAPVGTRMAGNYTPIPGDFNGDGFDDILWYSATDEQSLIRYGGSSVPLFYEAMLDIDGGQRPVAGDFDGDGRTDILIQTVDDDDYFLFGNSNGTFAKYSRGISGIYVPLVGDFDQDGFDDIFLYREGRHDDYLWWGNPDRSIIQSTVSASGTYNPTVGDFDGNGADDILWGDSLMEVEPLWLFTPERSVIFKTYVSSSLERETSGDARIPFAGDFDGNGISDVLWL